MSGRVAKGHLQVLQIYRLLQCVHEGDKAHIEKMVNLGVKNLINLTEPQEGTGALCVAMSANNQDLVSFLLSQGANPNIQDKMGRTPAMLTAEHGNDVIMTLLIQNNANLRLQDSEGKDMGVVNMEECTPLHYAAATGNANCCKFLAQRGCNPKLKNLEGLLPRQIAKDAGHKAAAKELKKAERQHGKGNKSTSGGLLSDLWGLTLHDWSNEYETELQKVCGNKSETVSTEMFISALEELKAPVDLEQIHQVISAHDKGRVGCININDFIKGVKYIKKPLLLSSYIPKKKKGEKGGKGKKGKFVLPLPICTLPPEHMPRRPDGGPPHFMIETFFNCSDTRRFARDQPPEHPIMNDSGCGNYEVAQFLLSRGADVEVCDQFFWTPLHHAAYAGQVELIELLVQAGAVVDARGLGRGTPLMRAIETSRPSCVDLLIKAGANVNAENKKGLNCLDIARVFADSRVMDMVKEKMDSMPKPKETKGKGVKAEKPKSAKGKSVLAEVAGHGEASAASAGKTSPQKESRSVVLQHTRISTGKTNGVDISFVPKTVWGKPPTTSQLMSKIERRKEPLSLEVDFDDFMMPLDNNQRKPTDQTGGSLVQTGSHDTGRFTVSILKQLSGVPLE
ncbi:hypothetical protein KUCAC02_007016, partial [Chaenocephalus aceratus]